MLGRPGPPPPGGPGGLDTGGGGGFFRLCPLDSDGLALGLSEGVEALIKKLYLSSDIEDLQLTNRLDDDIELAKPDEEEEPKLFGEL